MGSKLNVLVVGGLEAVGKKLLEVFIEKNALIGVTFTADTEKGISHIAAQKPDVVVWEIECTTPIAIQLEEMRKRKEFLLIIFSESTERDYISSHAYLKQYTFLNKQQDSDKLPNLILEFFHSRSENYYSFNYTSVSSGKFLKDPLF